MAYLQPIPGAAACLSAHSLQGSMRNRRLAAFSSIWPLSKPVQTLEPGLGSELQEMNESALLPAYLLLIVGPRQARYQSFRVATYACRQA
jgi:hypothetical protein